MNDLAERTLSKIADSGMHVHFATWAGVLFEALLVVGPVAMGILSFPSFAGLSWASAALGWAAASTITGWIGSKGASWVMARRSRPADLNQWADVSASLRAFRGVLAEGGDHVPMRKHLLSCITRAVARACGSDDDEIIACLLLPEAGGLRVTDYSGFRSAGVPAGVVPFNEKEGAPKAFRTQNVEYLADTQRGDDPEKFAGKKYRCILSYPLVGQASCLGVVSIDSPSPNEFDNRLAEIDAQVRPFVEVIHLTLLGEAQRPDRAKDTA